MRGCSQLNRVSRTRSGVGRIATPGGKSQRRPRCRPPMMRRTRDLRTGARAHHDPHHAHARVARLFPLFLTFTNVCACASWLATFWGPSVPYSPNTTSSAHRSERRGNATDLTLRNRIPRSELMKRLSAAVVICRCRISRPAARAPSTTRPTWRPPTRPPAMAFPGRHHPSGHARRQRRIVPARAGHLSLPDRSLLLGHHRRHHQHPAAEWPDSEPGGPQCARRLVDHRADPHPLRRRPESGVVQRREHSRVPGHGQQH